MEHFLRIDDGGPPDNEQAEPLSYWRTFKAEEFDETRKNEVADCVADIASTMPEWRAAIVGDAAAAIGLVLPSKPPKRIGLKVDLPMTTLLRCAFENAAAAFVLAHKLRQMPLDPVHRSNLATSWLVHNLWLGRRSFARRSIPSNLADGGEGA